jgi:hypothetical protein
MKLSFYEHCYENLKPYNVNAGLINVPVANTYMGRVIIILQGWQTFLLRASNLYEEYLTSHKHLQVSSLLFSTYWS